MKTQVVDNTRSFVAHTVEAVSANAFTGKPNRACDAIYAVEFQRCQVKTFSDFLYHALIAGRTLYGVFFQDCFGFFRIPDVGDIFPVDGVKVSSFDPAVIKSALVQ